MPAMIPASERTTPTRVEIGKAHDAFAPSDLARNGRLAWAYAERLLGDPLMLSHDQQVIRIAADAYRHEGPRSYPRLAVEWIHRAAGAFVHSAR
jgi:hypothetical protein